MLRNNRANGRKGVALLLVLMTLALTTLMGLYSVSKTVYEQQAANAMKMHVTLYAIAEAGIDHAVAILMGDFSAGNADKLSAGQTADWDFALDSSYYSGGSATSYYCEGCLAGESIIDGAWTGNGVDFIQRTTTVGGFSVTYNVSFWDNADYNNDVDTGNDDLDPTNDTDGVIIIRSLAEIYGPGGSFIGRAMHEATLAGTLSNAIGLVSGAAQSGVGAGKSGASGDKNAIAASDLGVSATI